MGCSCCRMIKSAIYDPSIPVDIHGRKRDPAGSSLYQPNRHHHLPGDGDPHQAKQGFYNLGFSSAGGGGGIGTPNHPTSVSNAKFDNANNHINYRLHGNGPPPTTENATSARTGKGKGGGEREEVDSGVKVSPPKESQGLKNAAPPPLPSVPPVYQLPVVLTPTSKIQDGSWDGADISRDGMMTELEPYHLPDGLDGVECCVDVDDEEERESGVGSTPDYLVDTGDEASVLSGDINTSSTSLSSADTREDKRGWRREAEGGEEEHRDHDDDNDDCQSVTDSMVAEALAALEAATAGEDDD